MFIKISRSIITLLILLTTLCTTTALAEKPVYQYHKGTMGSGYKQYINSGAGGRRGMPTKPRANVSSSSKRILDISEWQGALTDAQVKALKKNYDFIIIRGQYGSEYVDKCLANNSALLDKYNMKFGVYSYSMYENADDARYEARTLHQRAPKADFYINDYEQQTVKSGDENTATQAWAAEMKKLAGNKKVLFYSYENFMLNHVANAINAYDGCWLAAYQQTEPQSEHVLWQYTDHYYASELKQNVDANYVSQNLNQNFFIN